MTKLYLKKYITIYKALNKICIGFVGNEEEYLEMEYNSVNYELLEHLLKNGVDEIELFTFPYDELFKKGFMEIKATDGFSNSRSELYLNYLLGPAKSSFTAKNKKILIFGAGAGGSTLVYLLAQFGFNNIYIVDFDDVEESDLYRVITFDKIDLGEKKIDSLKRKIMNNFSIKLNVLNANLSNYDDLEKIITNIKPELIVKACDPKGLFLTNLNKICFKEQIPYIMMAYSYQSIKIGPLYVPTVTSCNEALTNYAVKMFGEHYRIEYFERMFGDYLFHPSISFNINILSSLIFKEILFFLLEEFKYCQTIGRLIVLNPLSIQTENFLIKCNDDCKICHEYN